MTTGTSRGGFGGSRELGKYRLINELAKRQLGALWAGITGEAGEEAELVLVRRFDTSVIENTDQVDNLSEAAWWAMELSSDEIARTTDVVKTENELGMIYAYTEGEVFRALLRLATFKRKPFPVPVALRIALDVLSAVGTTREQATEDHIELACGGLSPDSVFVGTDGMTRLLDVGAAGVLCAAERVLTNPEMAAYAAPEQLQEEPSSTARSDVFSAGTLIWEMLLAKRLFVGSSYAAVSAKVKEAKVARLDDARPAGGDAIPKEVADLVAKALGADPEERFADCREFIAAIEALSIEPAAREAVGEMVDALDGNALATRRKVIDRARGVKPSPTKAAAPLKLGAVASPPKPTSSPTAAAAPPKPAGPPKPPGGRPPPPPPRARMESLDSELLEPAGDSEAPESAGVDVDVELDAPAVPGDLGAGKEDKTEAADAKEEAAEAKAGDEGEEKGEAKAEGAKDEGEEQDEAKAKAEGTKAEDEAKDEGEAKPAPLDDIPPPPASLGDGSLPPLGDVSEGALISALTTESTRPGPPEEGHEKKADDEKAAAETTSSPEAAEATSSPDAAAAEASTLDATSEDRAAELAAIDERRDKLRKMVTIGVGGLAAVLILGFGISALTGHKKKAAPPASAQAPASAAPSATAAAATATETAPSASASAEPAANEADAGEADAGAEAAAKDAAPEAAAEDSGSAAAASATAEKQTAPPKVQHHRVEVPHHYRPRPRPKPRPKHKYTPSGI